MLLLLVGGRDTSGQTARSGPPPLVPESLVGSASFDLYCASCHGRNGKGDGPIASSLKTRPADLTRLSARNSGSFPRQRVLEYVDGNARSTGAHGSSEMPVWGPTLRALDPSNARVSVRLQNLVAFIESIQEGPPRTAGRPAADGRALYQAYCATCHGADARGTGPMVGSLRRLPPDLTTYTARNGGTFPSERLRQIIGGAGVAAHGDRSMPVWGKVFSLERGASEKAARERIDALVTYLQSIQRRGA